MLAEPIAIDALLAAALRGDPDRAASHPLATLHAPAVIERIRYHGVAGLLHGNRAGTEGWPEAISAFVALEARALTMWELRHRHMLNELLSALNAAGIVATLLKGTAVAYDLYPAPPTRSRGDTDLLVGPDDLAETRTVLAQCGFSTLR